MSFLKSDMSFVKMLTCFFLQLINFQILTHISFRSNVYRNGNFYLFDEYQNINILRWFQHLLIRNTSDSWMLTIYFDNSTVLKTSRWRICFFGCWKTCSFFTSNNKNFPKFPKEKLWEIVTKTMNLTWRTFPKI